MSGIVADGRVQVQVDTRWQFNVDQDVDACTARWPMCPQTGTGATGDDDGIFMCFLAWHTTGMSTSPYLNISMSQLGSVRTLTNKRRLVPSWILCCAIVAATLVGVSTIVGWQLRIPDLKGSSLRPSAARSVLFELDLVAVDPLQNIITLDWWIIGDDCKEGTAVSNASCSVVNVFVNPDEFLAAGGSMTPSDNGAAQPSFQHNPATLSLSRRSAFRTQLDLRSFPLPNILNPVDYPFDKYEASASIFARTNDTGAAVGVWIFNVTGAAFGFSTTLAGINVDSNTVTSVDFRINRAMSVKLYVVTIIFGMWLISLALLTVTIKALIFRHKMETALLVLPVATMIAFAQLRGSMPYAPAGFGTNIDLIGSLPTYVCLVLTTVLALVHCLSLPAPRLAKQFGDSTISFQSELAPAIY